ncbi:MAG: hypothetical protein ACREBH_00970, partial [Candidatus Micrarchaeaceae archaeon]
VKRYMKPILASMFISQYIFVVIYPLIILPRISQTSNFGGGLSLFGLFSLIAILFIIINDLLKKDYAKTLFKTKKDLIIGLIFPIIFMSAPLYMFLGFSNSITKYTPLALLLIFLPMILFVVFFMAWIRTALRVIRGTFPKQNNNINKQIAGSYFVHLMLISVVFSMTFSLYIAPFLLTTSGFKFFLVNSHNFGWPIFIVIMYIFWQKNWFGFNEKSKK